MGTSTNGLLWYGVAIDGSPEDGDEPAETIHALLYGDEDDEDEPYGDGREWMAEHGLTGIEFVKHCSEDYPMYGVAVAGTVTTARRGSPVRITDWREALDATAVVVAMKALGVEVEADAIGWHLASMWS